MRHAKSDWDADYGSDHERPLSVRGERSARLIGRMLPDIGLAPDHIISSTAVRARTTAEIASDTGGWASPMTFESSLYGTGPDQVIDVAARGPDVKKLMLVGHQPTWSMVLHRLTGARADMKTASVAAIDLMIEGWWDLPEMSGVLTALHHPRSFFGSEWDDEQGGSEQ